jgi:serine/threonine protein kinase
LGVAREFGALKPAGTPGYLPPEVMKILQGLSTDTSGVCQPENDVFALGVVLYTLLGSRKVYIHGKAHFPPCL